MKCLVELVSLKYTESTQESSFSFLWNTANFLGIESVRGAQFDLLLLFGENVYLTVEVFYLIINYRLKEDSAPKNENIENR